MEDSSALCFLFLILFTFDAVDGRYKKKKIEKET